MTYLCLIITITTDALENCLEGSGSRNGKGGREMVAVVHEKKNGGLDMGGDSIEGNILATELL